MNKRTKIIGVGASILALVAGGTGVALAGGGSEDVAEGPDVAIRARISTRRAPLPSRPPAGDGSRTPRPATRRATTRSR